MPKEVIADQFTDRVIGENEDHPPLQIVVGWTRDCMDVQVGSINPKAGGPHDPAAGWFTHLDRHGVNRLIRSLRKARDQAFGADA